MNRKKSREVAMKLLYQMSINKEEVEVAIESFIDNMEESMKEVDLSYVRQVLNGVNENLEQLDKCIEKYLINWKMSRLSKINLSILRICTYEVLFEEDIPDKVSINEAIELSKKYSEEKSFTFINGVLDKIIKNEQE
jgi:transcription antitermination protein NusB